MVLLRTTVATTAITEEVGIESETKIMTETTATESALHLRRAEENDHTEIGTAKITGHQAMTVEAEAGAEGLTKDDHDVSSHHQTRKS